MEDARCSVFFFLFSKGKISGLLHDNGWFWKIWLKLMDDELKIAAKYKKTKKQQKQAADVCSHTFTALKGML